MCIGELLRYVGAYLSGMPQVALVADQDSGHLLTQGMLTALLDPRRKASETSGIGDIVNKHHSMDVAVVVLHHTLSEALLACCVPQLDLDVLAVYFNNLLPKIHPDSGLSPVWKLARTESIGEASLANSRVSDHDDLKDSSPWGRQRRAGQR